MKLSNTQTIAILVAVVVVAIGVIVFLWNKSVPPEPTLGPGQTLKNPFGPQTSGGPGPGRPGGPGERERGAPTIPRPGTVDPQRGMGPSKGAPIPGMQ